MGMHRIDQELPDTFGLTEYFISDVVTEIDGPNVRMVCGIRRGGQIHWLYSVVMRADRLANVSQTCAISAIEASRTLDLVATAKGH